MESENQQKGFGPEGIQTQASSQPKHLKSYTTFALAHNVCYDVYFTVNMKKNIKNTIII